MSRAVRRTPREIDRCLDGPEHAGDEHACHRHPARRRAGIRVDAPRGVSRVRPGDRARHGALSRCDARRGRGGDLPEGRGGLPERRRHQEDHERGPGGNGLLRFRTAGERQGRAEVARRDPFRGRANPEHAGTGRGSEDRAGDAADGGDQGRRPGPAEHHLGHRGGARTAGRGRAGSRRPARPARGVGGEHARGPRLPDRHRDLRGDAAEIRPLAPEGRRDRPA